MPGIDQRPGRISLTECFTGVLTGLAICLVAAPSALVATFVLRPFWSWLESASGIEAIGHSGPAEWCYLSITLIIVCGAGLARATKM